MHQILSGGKDVRIDDQAMLAEQPRQLGGLTRRWPMAGEPDDDHAINSTATALVQFDLTNILHRYSRAPQ